MIVEEYEVYHYEKLIGKFTIDNENNVHYIPFKEVIAEIDLFTLSYLKEEITCKFTDNPFFYGRVTNMKKFNMNYLEYQNNAYRIKRIK